MIELSDEKVIELINEIVDEYGDDFVYQRPELAEGCMYVHFDYAERKMVPGCIVAHFLVRAGIPITHLLPHEGQGASAAVAGLEEIGKLRISNEARILLEIAQDRQDDGDTWGYSVWQARDYAGI